MSKIKIGIFGYGNLGKGVEAGIPANEDMELTCVITRRNPNQIKINTSNAKVYHIDDLASLKDKIDVLVMCSGSMSDLPVQGPQIAGMYNTIDGFDTHAKIPEYFAAMDKKAQAENKISLIASGWDPGLFSINRLFGYAVLPKADTFTFWGPGVSQGHSDAIRRIEGVVDARQYTIPIDSAVDKARNGQGADLTTRDKHLRRCFVVVKDGADKAKIENEIKTMPNYFADYDTEVNFISEEEMKEKHSKLGHGGFVIRSGVTGFNDENKELVEFRLNLDANPEFTANVLLAYARAVHRMNKEGRKGAMTVFDVPPAYLLPWSADEIRAKLL